MTLDEIAAILARLDKVDETIAKLKEDLAACGKNDAAMWRILYIILGVVLGSGGLTLSQVVGL